MIAIHKENSGVSGLHRISRVNKKLRMLGMF
jgi:hypothetical protein